MIDTFLQILAGVTPIVVGYLGIVLKIKLKKLEQSDSLSSLETAVKETKQILQTYIADNEFRVKFKNTIRSRSRSLHTLYSSMLPEVSRNALLKWADIIEKFGLDFFYAEQRKCGEKKRDEYLTSILNSHIEYFYYYLDSLHPEVKIFKSEHLTISGLMRKIRIHSRTEFLKITLVKNGLDTEAVVNLFDDYILEFAQDLSRAFQIWDKLEHC